MSGLTDSTRIWQVLLICNNKTVQKVLCCFMTPLTNTQHLALRLGQKRGGVSRGGYSVLSRVM